MKMNLLVGIFYLFAISALCLGKNEHADVKIKPFPILPWVAPQITEQQMKLFREANFTVMWLEELDENKYAQLKKHWDGNYIISTWWNRTEQARLESASRLLKFYPEDPKKIGYFIKDEPSLIYVHPACPTISDVKVIWDILKKEDPNRICFVNLYPTYAGETKIGGSYQDYIEAYFKLLKPRYCSFDHYPCYWFNVDRPDYYYNIELMRRQVIKNHSRMIGFVQVFSTGSLREVSESDIAWQVYSLLAYGSKGLWYFRYRSVPMDKRLIRKGALNCRKYPMEIQEYCKPIYDWGDCILDANDNPSYAYAYVKKINKEVLAWGPVLAELNSTIVRHCGNSGLGQSFMPHALPVATEGFHPESRLKNPFELVTNVIADNPQHSMGFVIGFFEDSRNRPYVMVVNKRHGENMSRQFGKVNAIIMLKQTVKKVYSISNITSQEENVDIKGSEIRVVLEGGSAILMRLEE